MRTALFSIVFLLGCWLTIWSSCVMELNAQPDDYFSQKQKTADDTDSSSLFHRLQIDSADFVDYIHAHHFFLNDDSLFLQVLIAEWAPDSVAFALAHLLERTKQVAQKNIRSMQIKRLFANDTTKMRHKMYKGTYGILKRKWVTYNGTLIGVTVVQDTPLKPPEAALLDILEFQNYLEALIPEDYVLPKEVELRLEIATNEKIETLYITLTFLQ